MSAHFVLVRFEAYDNVYAMCEECHARSYKTHKEANLPSNWTEITYEDFLAYRAINIKVGPPSLA